MGSDLVYTKEQGQEIAAALGQCKAVILRNHGAVTIGKSVAEAVVTIYYLERAAYAHLVAGTDLVPWQPDAIYLRLSDQSNFSGAPGIGSWKTAARWHAGSARGANDLTMSWFETIKLCSKLTRNNFQIRNASI